MTKHRRLYLTHNGEHSRTESSWTWECLCGVTESARTKDEAHVEWRHHRRAMEKVVDDSIKLAQGLARNRPRYTLADDLPGSY